jgi:hypothetical protein
MNLEVVWQWLKNAWPTIVVTSAVAWGYFQFIGKKWVEHRFSKDLEAFKGKKQKELEDYKSQQQQELERLRHRLSSRISKIHEKEFEVLPQAWLMLNDLRGAAPGPTFVTLPSHSISPVPSPTIRNSSSGC